MTDGRILNDIDFENELPVCIISWEIADRIRKKIAMNGTSADKFSFVGKVCTYNQQNFRIVGVFGPRDPDFKPRQLRRCVFIPVGAIQKYMTGDNPDPGTVRLMVKEPKTILDQAKKITKDLISLHRGAEDFEYRTADWLEEMSRMLSNVALLMSIISVISLLVGGMSIMNVMLSSIAERIHEIGVRKALGAKNSQIFIQFLVESITLCLVGGSAGGVVGLAPLLFKEAIKKSTQGAIEPTLLASHLVFVILIVTVVGIVFGLYPAIKAGKMNPVDALRYE
jgi:putative ABC transport system permease protein